MESNVQLNDQIARPEIVVTDAIDDQMREVIGDGLDGFNDEVIGYGDRKQLAVVVKNADGETLVFDMSFQSTCTL